VRGPTGCSGPPAQPRELKSGARFAAPHTWPSRSSRPGVGFGGGRHEFPWLLPAPGGKSVNVFMSPASGWLEFAAHRGHPLDDRVPFGVAPGGSEGLGLGRLPDVLPTALRADGNPKSEGHRAPQPAFGIAICHRKASGSVYSPRRGARHEPGTRHARDSTYLNRNCIKLCAVSGVSRTWLVQGLADLRRFWLLPEGASACAIVCARLGGASNPRLRA